MYNKFPVLFNSQNLKLVNLQKWKKKPAITK